MTTWNKGDRAECINDSWPDMSPHSRGCCCPLDPPTKGHIYLVQDTEPMPDGVLGLVLNIHTHMLWDHTYFRKLVPVCDQIAIAIAASIP